MIWPEIKRKSLGCLLVCLLRRENILVLDIFFEALNYEKIEQKKAYEIAGLLGEIRTLFQVHCEEGRKKKIVIAPPLSP